MIFKEVTIVLILIEVKINSKDIINISLVKVLMILDLVYFTVSVVKIRKIKIDS